MLCDRQGNQIAEMQEQAGFLKFLYRSAPGRCLLYLFRSRFMTCLVSLYMKSRLSVPRAKKAIRNYNVNLDELEETSFKSFNAFFTRRKKKEYLPFCNDPNSFIAPADSRLTVIPLTGTDVFPVKGYPYSAQTILDSEEDASAFKDGYAFVFRLAPDDYHHYIYPDGGTEESNRFIKGVFHTVSPVATEIMPVFHRNSREITLLNTEHFGKIAFIEVGAMLVGRIVNTHAQQFGRGDEKGYFEFGGSTVVVLTPQGSVRPDDDILANSQKGIETRVRLGEQVGTHV